MSKPQPISFRSSPLSNNARSSDVNNRRSDRARKQQSPDSLKSIVANTVKDVAKKLDPTLLMVGTVGIATSNAIRPQWIPKATKVALKNPLLLAAGLGVVSLSVVDEYQRKSQDFKMKIPSNAKSNLSNQPMKMGYEATDEEGNRVTINTPLDDINAGKTTWSPPAKPTAEQKAEEKRLADQEKEMKKLIDKEKKAIKKLGK
jgi:hypothetical protein